MPTKSISALFFACLLFVVSVAWLDLPATNVSANKTAPTTQRVEGSSLPQGHRNLNIIAGGSRGAEGLSRGPAIKPLDAETLLADLQTAQADPAVAAPSFSPTEAGILLTFDDKNVDDWYSFLIFNNKYGARATFYVCSFYQLDLDQIIKLQVLQKAGNEIGYHTVNHINALKMLKEKSLDYYLQNEIYPGIALMQEKGFQPKDFAYPFGAGNKELDEELLKHFNTVRYTGSTHKDLKIKDLSSVYIKNKKAKVFEAAGIDDGYKNSLEDILAGIDKAYLNNEIIAFYGHEISSRPGQYNTNFDRLEAIIKYAHDKGMKFYTAADLNH